MSARRQLLVVDDDPDIREALGGVLEQAGYDVVSFGDARSALTWIDVGGLPDLVLLDLMMPGMNGWEFRAELDARPQLADVPVVVLSGAQDGSGVRAEASLKKPVDLDVLLNAIGRWRR